MRLVAISCALFNDSLGADIKQFVEKTKKTYVRYVVQASDLNHATNYNDFMPNYEPGGNKPKNDSISYAQGYVDGKHWADSLTVKVDTIPSIKSASSTLTVNESAQCLPSTYP